MLSVWFDFFLMVMCGCVVVALQPETAHRPTRVSQPTAKNIVAEIGRDNFAAK